MAELVADCPRCGSSRISFDLLSAIHTRTEYGWQYWYETFAICRQCHLSTVFVLADDVNADYEAVHKTGLIHIDHAVNRYVRIEGIITLKDRAEVEAPEYVPNAINNVFMEGATCLKVDCWNAAATMFRLCIDLVTKGLLPEQDVERLNQRTRRNLGLRLPWLFDNQLLPESLRELSTCVREDGNDGAHAGTLRKADAEDLLDFTRILLERIYTEPERIRLAAERRRQRRDENA
ncbi:DUF4145 domain-containing protein [Billgrantia montanilacus]|uniref:DUF4145 domain-containing protein n=1 Tax=Billgrantia montanilacus TaxID=2282305 RepID=A0A368TQE2_9GAMM|nr:DUF4145 domain-containing protein [Halomonas montanilacus]RCV86945.1 DUF4145 domain-containing protein [Halomonas montanilacus]